MSQDKIRPLITAVVDLPVHLCGLVIGIVKALSGPNTKAAAQAFRQTLESVSNSKEQILRIVEGSQRLIIPACDGKNFLAKAKEVFKSFIDSDFTAWKLTQRSNATKEVAVEIYEMVKDATFVQMFGSIGTDLDKQCFTQHQIEVFCKVHHTWLRTEGYATFFLFKENEQYFVASVHVFSDGLYVYVRHFERGDVWHAEVALRLVVPQRTV